MKIYWSIITIFSLFIIGCVKTSPYIKPSSENKAFIEFPKSEFSDGFVQYMEDGENCGDIKSFTDETNPLKNFEVAMEVPANKRIAFNIIDTRFLTSCNVILSFELPKNSKYRFKKKWVGEHCYASLVKISNGEETDGSDAKVKQMILTGLNNDSCKVKNNANSSLSETLNGTP
ncbi:hypothetical protein [Methylotenera sp. N17]|uniref:hypothetical protein n=1 Tax=Methylotenera sp. N17 TaxID=1502761 RepID=UPI0006480077|nr:hypothetical protein [Methylotenera sp. N17]